MKDLLKNMELTNLIIKYTTILSNDGSEAWAKDTKKIIDFLCQAYENEDNEKYYNLVTYEIENLHTIDEYEMLLKNTEELNVNDNLSIFYNIKGKTISYISLMKQALDSMISELSASFDYRYVLKYDSKERRNTIIELSKHGNVDLTILSGILFALGIGGEKKLAIAKLKFLQAAYWGFIPGFKLASYVSKLEKKNKDHIFYQDMYDSLSKHLSIGITALPSDEKSEYSEEVIKTYALVSSIYYDVAMLYNKPNINFSFVEVMLMENLSFEKKMNYVNDFSSQKWKDETNNPLSKFGFAGVIK